MMTIYKSDGNILRQLNLGTLEKGAWINLINPDSEELAQISSALAVPTDFLRAALDEEERSRTETEENCLLVITNIPMMRGIDNYDTLPLGIILLPEYIITVCLEPNEVLADFNPENARFFSTFKKTRFLFQILYKSATLYLKYVKQINRRTDEIEKYLRKSAKNQDIFELLDLQKAFTYFTASLRSNGIVLDKLLRLRSNVQLQHLIKIYEEDEDLLEDVIIENKQAIEMVAMYSNILNSMLDTFSSIISNNLNMIMKFLTSVTILLAIPTMISSFFGMNVDVPWGEQGGFFYVSLLAIIATCVTAFGLWKKKFF